MRFRNWFVAAFAALIPAQDEFAWQTDLDSARAAAAKDGKPMLVVFR